MAEYVLSPEALNDLQNVWDFIAADNPEAANRMVDELFAAFERLAEWPGSGHTRRDLTPRDVRFWPVRSYLVVYREKPLPLQLSRYYMGHATSPQSWITVVSQFAEYCFILSW
jgi:antitoxin ParD1/3/4/toxin ParE1/3/4